MKWYGNCSYKLEGTWNSIASQMAQRFKETGHPVFTGASALSRGILRKLKGNETIHFNADASNTELLFRVIRSINQFSIHGAVSNWCEEFGPRPNESEPTSEKYTAKETQSRSWYTMVFGDFTQYAENVHFLWQTKDPERMQRFQEYSNWTSHRSSLRIIQNEHHGL